MKPRGQLMIEHRLIEKCLASAAESTKDMKEGRYDPDLIDTIVDFIKTYADRTHHGKEEDILFRTLSQRQISGDDLVVMNELIDEHKRARQKVGRIVESNRQFTESTRAKTANTNDIQSEFPLCYGICGIARSKTVL